MATASDYLKYNNPINSPSDPSRGFSDQIYIDFTQGKKSLDEQIKEIDLANKQLALEQQKLMPTDAAAQEFGWSKAQAQRAADQSIFDRQMAEAEEARRGTAEQRAVQSAVYEGQQNKRQNIESRMNQKKFKFDRRMSKQEMGLKQESSAREAQESALRSQATQQQMGLDKQRMAIDQQTAARAAEMAPYQVQAAKADAQKKAMEVAGLQNLVNPPKGSFQFYVAPANATPQQQAMALNSINNPNYWMPKSTTGQSPSNWTSTSPPPAWAQPSANTLSVSKQYRSAFPGAGSFV